MSISALMSQRTPLTLSKIIDQVANSLNPDETPFYLASHPGQNCLPGLSSERVNQANEKEEQS